VFAGIVFLLVVIAIAWLMLPARRSVPMTTLVGANAVAVAHLADCSEDAGVAALLRKLKELQREMQLEMIRQAGAGGGGRFAEMMVQMQHINSIRASQIPEVLVSVDPAVANGDSTLLVGVGVDTLPRLVTLPIKFVMKAARKEQGGTSYRGIEVVNVDQEARFALGNGLFLYATGMQPMQGAIDRIRDGRAATSIVAELPAEFVEGWDIYALGDNRKGQLERLFEESRGSEKSSGEAGDQDAEEIPFPWDDALFVRAGVDVVSADKVKCEWTVSCRTPEGAERWRSFGETLFATVAEDKDWDAANVSVVGRVEGRDAVVSIDLVGLEALLEEGMRRAVSEEPRAEPEAQGGIPAP